MTRTLLHVCGRYLPLSETFTYDLIRRLDGFTHHVVAASLENLDVFPLASVQAPVPEARVWPAVSQRRTTAAAAVAATRPWLRTLLVRR